VDRKLKFSEHIVYEGHEMRNIDVIMIITNTESNHININILEEIQ